MSQWDEGYVTDVAYTSNFHREITPAWLAMSSLLLGQRPPDLAAPFCYADLGCGNGFTTLIVAATSPQAEVWGFDFNPAHIEFASSLATRAGLGNVHFVETSFADLGGHRLPALPDFDFMVAHGVLSWVSPDSRSHLIAAIGRHLKPGGLVYLSYNVTTGWAAMVPVRTLMRMLSLASNERSDLSAAGVLDYIDRLKQTGALYFPFNASLDQRLPDIRRQDPRYIAHEFLNQHWNPLMFTEVAGAMADAKCRFIGSATLAENIDTVSVPSGVVPLLAETRDPLLRETLRDLGCAQGFRRDLYRRGTAPLHSAAQQMLLQDVGFAALGQTAPDGGIAFQTPIGTVTGRPEIYEPLLGMLDAEGSISINSIRSAPALADRTVVELVQALMLLTAGGYTHPMLPDGGTEAVHNASRRLNLAISHEATLTAELTRLAAPAIGSAVGTDILEVLLAGTLLAGREVRIGPLTDEVLAALARTGRSVQRDRQPVTDTAEARRMVGDALGNVLEKRVPVLQRLGVLDAQASAKSTQQRG